MSVLNNHVLILDKQYAPIQIATVKNAIPLLCIDKAACLGPDWSIYTFEEWLEYSKLALEDDPELPYIIRSPTVTLVIPEVMIITEYISNPAKPRRIKYNRSSIFKRDNYTCQYCAKKFTRKELTIDHIIPRSRGGGTNWLNVVAACKPCNSKKDDRTPEEARMPLLNQPRVPSWHDHLEVRPNIKKMWEHFL